MITFLNQARLRVNKQFNNHLKISIMKKSIIIFAVVLSAISMLSAQSRSSHPAFPNSYGSSSSIYSTPKVTNYNTTYNSGFGSSMTNQTYSTPKSYTTVNTTRTSLGNNNSMSSTDVFSNGSRRSSSRTTSIDFGGSRMTTTNYYDNSGKIKSSRTRTKNYGW